MLSTELAELKAHMLENPGAVIEDVARQRKVTPRAVIEALPPEMFRIGAGGEFASAMQDIADRVHPTHEQRRRRHAAPDLRHGRGRRRPVEVVQAQARDHRAEAPVAEGQRLAQVMPDAAGLRCST